MRGLQLHVVLALVALLAAVGSRRRERSAVDEGERLVDCAVGAVELSGPRSVRLEASDDGAAIAVRGGPTFRGGRAAEALLEDLGALAALRTFEAEPDTDYGFGEARLRIECPAESHEWRVGASPPGSADRYLGEARAVHLVDGALLRALEEAEVRLMRRELHDFDEAEVARVRVALADHEVVLVQRFGEDPRRRRYVAPGAPDERALALDRLMGAHRNLRAEAGSEPVDGEPLATVAFENDEGEHLGTLALHRVGGGPGAVFVVHTDAIGWVRVPRSTGAAFARALDRL